MATAARLDSRFVFDGDDASLCVQSCVIRSGHVRHVFVCPTSLRLPLSGLLPSSPAHGKWGKGPLGSQAGCGQRALRGGRGTLEASQASRQSRKVSA